MYRKGQAFGTVIALIIGVIMLVSVGLTVVQNTVTDSTRLTNYLNQNATPTGTGDTVTLDYAPYNTPSLFLSNGTTADSTQYTYHSGNKTYEYSATGKGLCHNQTWQTTYVATQQNATPNAGVDYKVLSTIPFGVPTIYFAAGGTVAQSAYGITLSNGTIEYGNASLEALCDEAGRTCLANYTYGPDTNGENCLANFTYAGSSYITSTSARTIFSYLPLFLALGGLVLVASSIALR